MRYIFSTLAIFLTPSSALANNIVISNDDGLTSNVKALYEALEAEGHDVIVSVPCSNQSGMGGALKFEKSLGALDQNCRNDAAKVGNPGAGPMTRTGFEKDYFYVNGTPVMALLYGLDVAAIERWGKAPDLVISGPNEGQNIGVTVISSGTVSNAQYAVARGVPAIALSASTSSRDDTHLANPESLSIAKLTLELVKFLDGNSKDKPLLPSGIGLNVNIPDQLDNAKWKLSRIGTYSGLKVEFASDRSKVPDAAYGTGEGNGPGIVFLNNMAIPNDLQMADESVVVRKDIAISVMQTGYDARPSAFRRIKRFLRGFLSK